MASSASSPVSSRTSASSRDSYRTIEHESSEEHQRQPQHTFRPSKDVKPFWSGADLDDPLLKEIREFSGKHSRRMRRAKRKHRTDLEAHEWAAQGHFAKWQDNKARLVKEAVRLPPIVDASSMETDEFRENFERRKIPCVLTGCAEAWPAKSQWNFARLREDFGGIKFKCGEDDDGYPIKVKLETFCRYIDHQLDDSPLYVFDTSYERNCPPILKEYSVPSVFPEDLFALVGEKRRPPHRWFLMGPERSGTTVHIDPLETSAWNTSIRGRKLWVMFPPDVSRTVVKGKRHVPKGGDDEAIDYFSKMLPVIMREDLTKTQRDAVLLFIQHPGQTVFVPHGWWHAVLNLDNTIAITHNYVSSINFPAVWRSVRTERRKMAKKWRSILKYERPDLYSQCREIDREDDFDLEDEIERRKAEKLEKAREKQQKKQRRSQRSESESSD